MPDDVRVEITNAPQVAAMWHGIRDDLAHLDPAMEKALGVAVAAAQASAPRATGRLAGSHAIGPGSGPNRVRLTDTAPYARMVHNGTRYLRARPWLADALTATEPQWSAALTAQIQTGLEHRASST